MSKLDALINELCPDGVEYKPLEKCCNILDRKRKPVTKSAREIGKYPYYGANGIQDYVSDYIFDGKFVLVGEDGSVITKNGNPVVTWAQGKIWVNNHAHIIEEINGVLLRYLYHFIQTVEVTSLIHGNIPKLTGGDFKAISIPLPPLPIQEEIVRILDNFTELTAELTAELTDRKKQYEYYRDELFGKDYDKMINRCLQNNVDVIALEDLGSFTRGKRFVRNDIKDEGTPCIHYGDLYTYYGVSAEKTKCFLDGKFSEKMRFAHKGDIVIVQAGENDMDIGIGVAWMGEKGVAVHDACYIFKHSINPKYISHYLRTNIYHLQIKKYVSTGKICSISAQGIGKAKIPLPSLAEQQRIVDILDRFDTLCNDISNGLPAEIEARQQQYEYYRDKLLTFQKKEA